MQISTLSSAFSYAAFNTPKANASNAAQTTSRAAAPSQPGSTQQFDARGVSYSTGTYTITNPIDSLMPSDKALFRQATGLVLNENGIQDGNGNDVYTPGAFTLMRALCDMRAFGVPGAHATSTYQSGAFTAADIENYINAYKNQKSFDGSGLENAIGFLSDKKAS